MVVFPAFALPMMRMRNRSNLSLNSEGSMMEDDSDHNVRSEVGGRRTVSLFKRISRSLQCVSTCVLCIVGHLVQLELV